MLVVGQFRRERDGRAVFGKRNILAAFQNAVLRVIVNNPVNGDAVAEQGERNRTERNAARKIVRAVNRVEHPSKLGVEILNRSRRRQGFFRAKSSFGNLFKIASVIAFESARSASVTREWSFFQ